MSPKMNRIVVNREDKAWSWENSDLKDLEKKTDQKVVEAWVWTSTIGYCGPLHAVLSDGTKWIMKSETGRNSRWIKS